MTGDCGLAKKFFQWNAPCPIFLANFIRMRLGPAALIGKRVLVQFDSGTRTLRVIHGRDARATLSN
jgi:hypothetical protein